MTSFVIQKQEITSVLSKITGIVENKSSIQILSNLAIKVGQSSLTITATDMDISGTIDCNAIVKSAGDFTVPARQFFDICKKASNEDITVDVEDGKAKIKSGRSKFTLGTLPIADFPQFSVRTGHGFEIDAGLLLKLIDDVDAAISIEDSRHYLQGIFFHEMDGRLSTVATDGHQLSQSYGDAMEGLVSVIIPRKTVSVLQKLLGSFVGKVNIVSIDNKIQFTIGTLTLVSKVIDGTYPDYKRIMPQTYKSKFSFETDTAIKALDRICTIEEVNHRVKFSLTKGLLTLELQGKDENAQDSFDCEYDGAPIEIFINSLYVSNALDKIKTGTTVVQFNDPNTALLFNAANDENSSFLVMPMR